MSDGASASARDTASFRRVHTASGGIPRCTCDTGNSLTSRGSIPWRAKSAGSLEPRAGSFTSPRAAAIAAKNSIAARNATTPAGVAAYEYPRAVVWFHREDPATGGRDAGALTYRGIDVTDVLQHGHAERRVEHTVSERQAANVSRRESNTLVVRGGLLLRELHAINQQIHTDQTDLRDMKAPDAYLGRTLPAADIENPVARPGSECLREKLSEVVIPPPRAEVLQRRRGQDVDGGSQRFESGKSKVES